MVATALDAFEFERCKFLGVFTEAYPLHDCDLKFDQLKADENEQKSSTNHSEMRRHLHNHWARFRNWKFFQPFDAIQVVALHKVHKNSKF